MCLHFAGDFRCQSHDHALLHEDQKCQGIERLIREEIQMGFQILPLTVTHKQAFGELDLDD